MAVRSKVWPVERYARYVAARPSGLSQGEEPGLWEEFGSQSNGGRVNLVLVESSHLMITHEDQIFESFSLWNAQNYVKAFQRGDSILFIYHFQDKNRRFRVKMAPSDHKTPSEVCVEISASLSQLMPVQNMTEHPQKDPPAEGSKGNNSHQMITLKETSEKLLDPNNVFGRIYADTYLPVSHLPQFIRLCLTDANFPSFVEAVEKELNEIRK